MHTNRRIHVHRTSLCVGHSQFTAFSGKTFEDGSAVFKAQAADDLRGKL